MGVVYTPGQVLVRGDLEINTEDSAGNPTNVYSITYALYYVDPTTDLEILIADNDARIPVNPAIGEYYASLQVPANADIPGSSLHVWSMPKVQPGAVDDAVTVPARMLSREQAVSTSSDKRTNVQANFILGSRRCALVARDMPLEGNPLGLPSPNRPNRPNRARRKKSLRRRMQERSDRLGVRAVRVFSKKCRGMRRGLVSSSRSRSAEGLH